MPNISYDVLLGVIVSGLISYLINSFLVQRANVLRLIDEPNHRSSHSTPTPRAGGLGILFGFTTATIIVLMLFLHSVLILVVLLIGWTLALIGFYDDLVSSSAIIRLGFQMLAIALLLVTLHHFLPIPTLEQSQLMGYIVIACAFLGGVWFINLYNFMDGINGFAALEAIFVMLIAATYLLYQGTVSLITPYMLILAAACFGFLLWNFPRAKIFMGDTGSLFLGFLIVFFALYTVFLYQISIISWLIWLSIFWVDATYTLFVRIFSGQRFHAAHRSHLYQIFARRWGSHVKVVIAALIYNILWLLPLSFLNLKYPHISIVWLGMAILPILFGCVILGSGKNNH